MNNEIMGKIMQGKKKLTPIKAIKLYCKGMCCAGDLKSWKECTFTNCALYPYRFGRRPTKTTKQQSNEEK